MWIATLWGRWAIIPSEGPWFSKNHHPCRKYSPAERRQGPQMYSTYLWEMNRLKSQAPKRSQAMAVERKSFPALARCERADNVVPTRTAYDPHTIWGQCFMYFIYCLNSLNTINIPHSLMIAVDPFKRLWKSMLMIERSFKSSLKGAQKIVAFQIPPAFLHFSHTSCIAHICTSFTVGGKHLESVCTALSTSSRLGGLWCFPLNDSKRTREKKDLTSVTSAFAVLLNKKVWVWIFICVI